LCSPTAPGRCFPFKASLPEEELLRAINTADFAFDDPGWRKVSDEALDVVRQLLQRDPTYRPFLEEVLQHPFCAETLQEVTAADESRRERFQDPQAFDAALAALELDSDGDEDLPR
jgi:serine/threonine protein kinase